ncbi:MAG: DUF4340 domain-containing protein [Chitinispirillales bacterium]|jgi:hypothetical protein|nr:DUF4340 domain-containing protein [Chitinispirillales bacterium]
MSKKLTAGLLALALVIAVFITAGKLDSRSPADYKTKFFPHLEERSITALIITEGETSVKLDKKEGAWMVSKVNSAQDEQGNFAASADRADEEISCKADSASVQIAIEKIVSMKKGDLVSDNPANQSTFEVDSANGISVAVFTSNSGSAAGILRIGKTGADWNSNYVRLMGSNSVYSVGGGLRYSIFSDIEKWREKEVAQEERETVEGSD